MVKEMSEKVQFLFVSHNKATMEAAHQLSGVTMREPASAAWSAWTWKKPRDWRARPDVPS